MDGMSTTFFHLQITCNFERQLTAVSQRREKKESVNKYPNFLAYWWDSSEVCSGAGSSQLFLKELDRKYFRLCGPCGLCHDGPTADRAWQRSMAMFQSSITEIGRWPSSHSWPIPIPDSQRGELGPITYSCNLSTNTLFVWTPFLPLHTSSLPRGLRSPPRSRFWFCFGGNPNWDQGPWRKSLRSYKAT